MKKLEPHHYNSELNAKRYHDYWKQVEFPEIALKRGRERVNRFIGKLSQGAMILDAGCGTGTIDGYFQKIGFHVTGIDSSPEMLGIAREENPGVFYKVMDICDLRFEPASIDGVWTSGVLLHLPYRSLKSAMSEFVRVLRRDGILFVSTRTAPEDQFRIEDASEGGTMEVFYYSEPTLFNIMKKVGLQILWHSVDPDDSGRPFDYVHLLCKKE